MDTDHRGEGEREGCKGPWGRFGDPSSASRCSSCQVSGQKPAAGKTNRPILHVNGNAASSHFPSIYFWVLLERKKKRSK